MATFSQISDPALQKKLEIRYSETISSLENLGFRHLAYCLEDLGPFTAITKFLIIPLALSKGEILVLKWPFKLASANILLAAQDPPAIALCMGMGVKFYSGFSDGTIMISSDFVSSNLPPLESPVMRLGSQATLRETWISHQAQVNSRLQETEPLSRKMNFEHYVEMSAIEEGLTPGTEKDPEGLFQNNLETGFGDSTISLTEPGPNLPDRKPLAYPTSIKGSQFTLDYMKRYQDGEYAQVWHELAAIYPLDEGNANYAQAWEVSVETMQRVRRNCERIISRLEAAGYQFGTYPDGTQIPYTIEPLISPSSQLRSDLLELASEAGPLPLSLKAFWEHVGAIDLIGMHPEWQDGLDPIVVYPPEALLDMLYEVDDDEDADGAIWFAGLSPDDLHKDNVSGGGPYGLYLPNPAADFKFKFERHDLFFVQYLRLALLRWGGFPGLDGTGIELDIISHLTSDLELF